MVRIIKIVSTTLAALCLIAAMPWLLGIPGVENDYARGWKLGLGALIGFPLVHRLLSLVEGLAQTGRLRLQSHRIARLQLAALLAFAIAQAWAWSLILR